MSKPLFIYYRAVLYALFGDGELYALALSQQLLRWVVAISGVCLLASLGPTGWVSRAFRLRAGLTLLALLSTATWIWLSFSLVTYASGAFSSWFSEGPAATATLLSFGLLIGAVAEKDLSLSLAAGATFGLGVLCRTSNLPLALVGLVLVCFGATDIRRWIRASVAYGGPIAIALLAIWLHAGAPFGLPVGVREYVAANTGVPHNPPGLSYFHGLVPGRRELGIILAVFCALATALAIRCTFACKLRLIGLGAAVVLGAFIPLIPQLAAPYWPRALMTSYYVMSLMPTMVLIYHWRASLPGGAEVNGPSGT